MKKFWKKLPKWGKILVWILAGIVGLILLCVLGFKAWTLTWKTYTNDEFGFSFRYPASWHISGNPINKEYFEQDRGYFFIDSKAQVSLFGEEMYQHPGNVTVSVIKKPTPIIQDALERANKYNFNFKVVKYGNRIGYAVEGLKGRDSTGRRNFTKVFYVETPNYVFNATTITFSSGLDYISNTSSRFYHLIGSTILDSFKFN